MSAIDDIVHSLESKMDENAMDFACTNDACRKVGVRVSIGSEGDVECPTCGWMMSAVYE